MAHDTSWERLRLYTDRLCLRAPAPGDAGALYDLFADAEVMQGLGKEPVSVVEDVRAMIEEEMMGGWRTDGLGAFILVTTGTDRQVVGQAGLMIFDTRDWTPIGAVTLNPERDSLVDMAHRAGEIQPLAA